MTEHQHTIRHVGDIAAIGAAVAAWIAPAAGLLTLVWTGMRIVEMLTGHPFHKTRFARFVVRLFRPKRPPL